MKALIIGHSQVKYFQDYVVSSDTQCLSYSGCKIEELLQQPEVQNAIPETQIVAVLCGINNIPRNSPDMVVMKFKTLVAEIKDLNPDVKIILSTILPRELNLRLGGTQYSKSELVVINEDIFYINEQLKDYSKAFESLYVLEHPQFVTPTGLINESLLAADGLHLSFKGTELIVENFESAIMEVKGLCFSIINNSVIEENPPSSTVVTSFVTEENLSYSDVVRYGDVRMQHSLERTGGNKVNRLLKRVTNKKSKFIQRKRNYIIDSANFRFLQRLSVIFGFRRD